MTFDSTLWRHVEVGFALDVDFDYVSGEIVIDDDQLDGIWWRGYHTGSNEWLAYDIGPSYDADGDIENDNTWWLEYTEVVGAQEVAVHLEGTWK